MQLLKSSFLSSACGLAMLSFVATAHAASITTDANVNIVIPVSITQVAEMDFGIVARPSGVTSSVVSLGTNGSRSISGGTGALVSGGTPAAASYNVFGTNTYLVDISVSNLSQPGTGLTLSNFIGKFNAGSDINIDVGDGGQATLTALSETTGDLLKVGADLTVANTATAGAHVGTFDLIINYN
ncbi:MAG: DUF4402 domain-containing protein [Alphaproteobacteria bacterium]|nr:DUF4402 domain-containing protein [Alphaproteobacteria bacterium]